jgi:hypothetical protein
VTPRFVQHHPVYCAVRGAHVLGFYALSGVGARMFDHAVATLRAADAHVLRIASDPYAEGFYLRMGARRVGEWPSTPSGRTLPLLVFESGPRRRMGI